MKEVLLDGLPIHIEGLNKGKINWKNSVGSKVNFIYDELIGELEIVNYVGGKSPRLTIKYDDRETALSTGQFQKGRIGNVLWRRTTDHIYKIGTLIENIKCGKLILLNAIRTGNDNHKAYEYKCLLCGNEDSISEYHLRSGVGCGVCYGKKALKGYNDMHTTDPELGILLWDYEDGYKYTAQSNKKIHWKCPDCGEKIENKVISTVYRQRLSCPRCSDGISYPEKFISNLLIQLGVGFEYQKTFEWSKNYSHSNKKLCGNKKYDFYIDSISTIIEIHGLQHYEERSLMSIKNRTLKEEQENDDIKKRIANENRIKNYIVVDARKSNMEYIKGSILHSEINKLFDLNNIDWFTCHQYACKSLVKVVCDLWNEGVKNATKIAELVKVHRFTVSRYLKQGAVIGLCDYDPTNAANKVREEFVESLKRKVVRLTVGNDYIDEFDSLTEAGKKFNTNKSNIYAACTGKVSTSCGYKWMYKDDYDTYSQTERK